jgi:hypothetical protein
MLAGGHGRNGVWRGAATSATVSVVQGEPVIHRDEAISLMFIVTDILGEVRRIRRLLEGDDDGEEEEERVSE